MHRMSSNLTSCHKSTPKNKNNELKNFSVVISNSNQRFLSAYLHRNAQINYQSLNERENENEEQKLKNFTNAKNINSIKQVQNIIFIRLRRHKKEK